MIPSPQFEVPDRKPPVTDNESPSWSLLWCLLPQTLVFLFAAVTRGNLPLGDFSHHLNSAAMLSQGMIVGGWIVTWPGNVPGRFMIAGIWLVVNGVIMRFGFPSATEPIGGYIAMVALGCIFPSIAIFGVTHVLLKLRLSKTDQVTLPKIRFGIRHLLISTAIVAIGTWVVMLGTESFWWRDFLVTFLSVCGIIPSVAAPLITKRRFSLFAGSIAAVLVAVASGTIATYILTRGTIRFDGIWFYTWLEITMILVFASFQTFLSTYLLRRAGYRLTMRSIT